MAHPLFKAALIGAVAGMRSMSAPALVAAAAGKDREAFGGFGLIAEPIVQTTIDAAAGLELAADKLPFIPSRLDVAPLAFRAVSGAFCGAAIAKRERENPLHGAIVGGVAAVASAYFFFTLRRAATEKIGVPDSLAAAAEDTAAYTLGRIATT